MVNGIRASDSRKLLRKVKDAVRSSEFGKKHLKKAGGDIDRNVVNIRIKIKAVVRKP